MVARSAAVLEIPWAELWAVQWVSYLVEDSADSWVESMVAGLAETMADGSADLWVAVSETPMVDYSAAHLADL